MGNVFPLVCVLEHCWFYKDYTTFYLRGLRVLDFLGLWT